jgi:carbonic anhydrase/acetyltransferase-like protein (isoleucine patch superfamily)
MAVRSFKDRTPRIAPSAFVDQTAVLIGDVVLEEHVSVWPGTILRGDDDRVTVGRGSAIMDVSFVEAPQGRPATVGKGCLISHGTRLHGCTVLDGALVGIGAIILDGAVIGEGAIIGAGSIVTPETRIDPRSLAIGVPAKVARPTTGEEAAWILRELRALKAKSEEYKRTQTSDDVK